MPKAGREMEMSCASTCSNSSYKAPPCLLDKVVVEDLHWPRMGKSGTALKSSINDLFNPEIDFHFGSRILKYFVFFIMFRLLFLNPAFSWPREILIPDRFWVSWILKWVWWIRIKYAFLQKTRVFENRFANIRFRFQNLQIHLQPSWFHFKILQISLQAYWFQQPGVQIDFPWAPSWSNTLAHALGGDPPPLQITSCQLHGLPGGLRISLNTNGGRGAPAKFLQVQIAPPQASPAKFH